MTIGSTSFGTDIRLSATPQIDEKKNPDIYNDLSQVHNAVRLLQQYLDAFTGARLIGRANVAINAGQFVSSANNYADLAGFHLAANGTYNDPCIGFATSTASAGQGIEVQTIGIWPYGNGGLLPGAPYYLGVGGSITSVAPAGAGKLLQVIGFAVDVNNLLFRPAFKYKEL